MATCTLLTGNYRTVPIVIFFLFVSLSCSQEQKLVTDSSSPQSNEPSLMTNHQHGPKPATQSEQSEYSRKRERMVDDQLVTRDIVDRSVLDVMRHVPRHEFVPEAIRPRAYDDTPLPIGHEQTISQPYLVALMTQLVEPKPHKKALDIGTGSGYQAAVLAELVKSVYSIEIVKPLADEAKARLQSLGYKNITVKHGDGYGGWESEAPFDIIIVAAAPDHVPRALVDQLAPAGKMVIPVGDHFQDLLVIEKDTAGNVRRRTVASVRFVPMTGDAKK